MNPLLHSINNEFTRKAGKEMDDLEKTLEEELAKHFSLQFDIRQYENLPVELEDNQVSFRTKLTATLGCN